MQNSMIKKMVGKPVSVKIRGMRTPIVGTLKGVDRNLIIENNGSRIIARGDAVQSIALDSCPYLKPANPEKGFDCALCESGESCTLSPYKGIGYVHDCLTYRYRHLYGVSK